MPAPTSTPSSLDRLLERASELLSLPGAALELLRLVDDPKIDARALCDCLEQDPALTAKLLRVVNSPLYGLPGEVATLPQAIALLGTQPLKLLVLGFALPAQFGEGSAAAPLGRYWSETLARAAGARAIAQRGWGRLDDEALVAGLLLSIGQLLLLGQFSDDYAAVLHALDNDQPRMRRASLADAEREALGFDHRELSAAMATRWGLPDLLANPIAAQAQPDQIGALEGDTGRVAQALRLADLLARLIASRDLAALPDLLEEGHAYCGLQRADVNDLVADLQPRVDELSAALAVELAPDADFSQALLDGHARLTLNAEQAAGRMNAVADDPEGRRLLAEARRLSATVSAFLGRKPEGTRPGHVGSEAVRPPHRATPDANARVRVALRGAAGECRQTRRPLAYALVEPIFNGMPPAPHEGSPTRALRAWLERSPLATDLAEAQQIVASHQRLALIAAGHDRIELARLWSTLGEAASTELGAKLDVGVAAVASVPAGFDAERLVEAAERCLSAANSVSGPAIKSIEVF